MEHEAQKNQSVLVQIGYTTNSLLQAVGPSRLLSLPFFPVVLASLLILLAVVQNFYKKKHSHQCLSNTNQCENNKLINWKFVSFIDSFSSYFCVVVFGLCVIFVVYIRDYLMGGYLVQNEVERGPRFQGRGRFLTVFLAANKT